FPSSKPIGSARRLSSMLTGLEGNTRHVALAHLWRRPHPRLSRHLDGEGARARLRARPDRDRAGRRAQAGLPRHQSQRPAADDRRRWLRPVGVARLNLYLARKHGRLCPATLEGEARAWQWSLWAANEVERGVNIWSLHALRLPPED